jgi:hypothetical protein
LLTGKYLSHLRSVCILDNKFLKGKGMIEDIKLSGIITDNAQTSGQDVMKYTTDDSSLMEFIIEHT